MLFQNIYGNFIEINRCDYKTDSEYYMKIIQVKGYPFERNEPYTDKRVISALKNKLRTRTRTRNYSTNQ